MKWRVAVAAAGAAGTLTVAGLAIAQSTWTTVDAADVRACRPVFAQIHQLEQQFLLDQIDALCARGTADYDADLCTTVKELLSATREIDDVDWYLLGNEACDAGSPYPCYGPGLYNQPRTGRDAQMAISMFREDAARDVQISPAMSFGDAAAVGDRCIAKAWLAKHDGVGDGPAVVQAGGGKSSGKNTSSKTSPEPEPPPQQVQPKPEPEPQPPKKPQQSRTSPTSVKAAVIPFAPDDPRGQVAPLATAQAAACEAAMSAALTESETWKGTPEEVALRLGLMQRTLYAGRCAGHPQAAGLVVEAERKIATSAASAASAFTDAAETSPDAISCVEPMAPNNPKNPTGSPALRNTCSFPVQVAYCNVDPAKGSWAEMFACGKKQALGIDIIPANGATPAVFGREVQHFACREPAGPVVTYQAGKGLDGFCK